MKKTVVLSALTVTLALLLTSCDARFGGVHYDVSWWVLAIPPAVILMTAHISLVRKRYRCPVCRAEFRPQWYEISVWLHDGGNRAVKCPHCGRRGFCPPVKD